MHEARGVVADGGDVAQVLGAVRDGVREAVAAVDDRERERPGERREVGQAEQAPPAEAFGDARAHGREDGDRDGGREDGADLDLDAPLAGERRARHADAQVERAREGRETEAEGDERDPHGGVGRARVVRPVVHRRHGSGSERAATG